MLDTLRTLLAEQVCRWLGHDEFEIEDGLFTRAVCRHCRRVRVLP